MSLRGRLTLLVSAAVALAVVVLAATAWILVRSAMLADVDSRLMARASQTDRIVELSTRVPADSPAQQQLRVLLEGDSAGMQLISPDGRLRRQLSTGPLTEALRDPGWVPPVPSGTEPHLDTVQAGDSPYRVLTARVGPDGSVLRLFEPLTPIHSTLDRITVALSATAVVGVALAAGLGWLVSRSGLRPVDRLVAATESVGRTKDLTRRIVVPPGRRDEIGRLAGAVNRMLASLEGAHREQREMVENAEHELRTPLAVLRNDFGLLARSERGHSRALSPAERVEVLDDLDAQVAALAHSVGEIVDLARGEIEPEPPRPAEVRDVVERAVARARGIDPTVAVEVLGTQATATVRPVVLERAVANLVRNAVQVSPEGGTVEVGLSREGGELVIDIRDRGPGLDPAELPHLFERFFRGAAARSRHGSGLGLAIVVQAAELHGGAVGAANRPGGGAHFSLRWPARAPEGPDAARGAATTRRA